MSDRIVVMNEGRVEQIGTPFEIYNQPQHPLRRVLRRHADDSSGKNRECLEGNIVARRPIRSAPANRFTGAPGKTISVALRPEAIAIGKGGDNANRLDAKVESVNFLGSIVRVKVRTGTQDISLDMFNQSTTRPPKSARRSPSISIPTTSSCWTARRKANSTILPTQQESPF